MLTICQSVDEKAGRLSSNFDFFHQPGPVISVISHNKSKFHATSPTHLPGFAQGGMKNFSVFFPSKSIHLRIILLSTLRKQDDAAADVSLTHEGKCRKITENISMVFPSAPPSRKKKSANNFTPIALLKVHDSEIFPP